MRELRTPNSELRTLASGLWPRVAKTQHVNSVGNRPENATKTLRSVVATRHHDFSPLAAGAQGFCSDWPRITDL